MALRDVGRRIIESVEERVGHEIVPKERGQILESLESDNRVLRKTLDFVGWSLFNYQGSQPSPYRMPNDMLPQARIFAAGQALRAWIDDPMAGQLVDLYISFVFGRGVPKPQAHDDQVQDLLDRTWADPANQRVLTSFDKLTEKGIDLCNQANVYWTLFDDGADGAVRLSLLRFEDVLDVVRHPVDTYRVLYYKVSERRLAYDYGRDAYVTPPGDSGKPQLVYYEAYGAFNDDDPVMVAQDNQADLEKVRPPANRLRPGKIVHLAVNKTSEMAFGVPRARRMLRWHTAFNEVLESHVNRMKAAASIYMKQTAKGDQRTLDRLAMMATGRQSAFGDSQEVTDPARPFPHHRGPTGPMTPGILQSNESLQWDPFKIDSGAADVAASMPQLRAQISGPFSPAYYGQDPGALAGQQCHDALTETLTEDGWLSLPELKARAASGSLPRVAAFDIGSRSLVYQQPVGGLRLYDYEGEMVAFRSRGCDMLVTPNHRMLVRRAPKHSKPRGDYQFVEAGSITPGVRWEHRVSAFLEGGERVETFTLPAYPVAGRRHGVVRGAYAPSVELRSKITALLVEFPEPSFGECACGCGERTDVATRNHHGRGIRKGDPMPRRRYHIYDGGRTRRIAERLGCSTQTVLAVARGAGYTPKETVAHPVMRPAITMPMNAWLRWLGWYIAEGSEGQVAQSAASPWLPRLREDCNALGVEAVERVKGGRAGKQIWVWAPRNGGQWCAWLDEHVGVGAENKRVPRFVWALSAEQQMEVLRGIVGGDGNGDPEGRWETQGYTAVGTISRGLADDVQRLALHCGFRAKVSAQPSYMTKKGERTPYVIGMYIGGSSHALRHHAGLAPSTRQRYRGEVYCFTTPAGTLVTRRNGRVAIHGNSVELPILKYVEREQEQWAGVFRTLGEAAVKRAVEMGDITEWRDPTEEEVQRIESWQKDGTPLDGLILDPDSGQVKRDLSFELSLPSPLKRAMGDLVTAAVTTATAVDPMGTNPELSRWLFGFVLAEAFDVEDPQRIVDQVLPRHLAEQMAVAGQPLAAPGQDTAVTTGADGQRHPPGNPYGARVQAPNPEDRPVQEAASGRRRAELAASADRRALVDEAFVPVGETAAEVLRRLNEVPALSGNGNGNGNGGH